MRDPPETEDLNMATDYEGKQNFLSLRSLHAILRPSTVRVSSLNKPKIRS